MEVSIANIAVPMAIISSGLSSKSILGISDEFRPPSEYWLVYLEECDDSEVGDVDAGDEGVVDAVDTETDDDAYVEGGEVVGRGILYIRLRMFMRSAYVSCYVTVLKFMSVLSMKNRFNTLTIDFNRLTSSSCATTLLLRPFFFL